MMYKHSSLVTAENVVNLAMQYMNSQEGVGQQCYGLPSDFRTLIESYQNCREQGLLARPMFDSKTAYSICNPRRRDGICIYKGAHAPQGISKDAYDHSNTFETVEQAAEWLVADIVALYHASKASKDKKST
jgi:hypothetical protein